jgi:uncharacterized protein
MPVVTSYPGVYLEEIPSSTRTVTSVTTSATAFADFFARGPVGQAVKVTSFRDFTRAFGGLDTRSEASYGIYQYFNNGGATAWVVRATDGAVAASFDVDVLIPTLGESAAAADTAAGNARTAADAAATAANAAAEGTSEAVLQSFEAANATLEAAAQTQKVADETKKAASDPNAGTKAGDMTSAATSAGEAAQKAKEAAQLTLAAVAAVDGAETAAELTELSGTAAASAQDASKAAQDAAKAAQAAAKTVPKEVTAQADINAAATAANTAATAADTAAKAAASAQSSAGGDDSEESADDLAKNVGEVATQTSAAATATNEAAKATAQTAQELQIAIQQATASSGKVAIDAQTAAIAAAEAAEVAAEAAEAAQEAADAAAAADPNDPASKALVSDAVAKAAAAAKAARKASQQAVAAQQASDDVEATAHSLQLQVAAANPGAWGNQLRIAIQGTPAASGTPEFKLDVQQLAVVSGKSKVVAQESYLNLSLDPNATRYAPHVVNDASALVQLTYVGEPVHGAYPQDVAQWQSLGVDGGDHGDDGGLPAATALNDAYVAALSRISPDTFNIMCLPITAKYSVPEANTALSQAMQFCEQNRAFLVVDPPPSVTTVADVESWSADLRNAEGYSGALYFPRLVIPDPLREYRPREVGPSGTVAGIYARTDLQRGVWKAPAGIEAVIEGADLAVKLTDNDSGDLNPLGINVLRSFPIYGNVVWGARTLAGADQLQSQWKYVNIRRLTDYIEESLFQSLKWVVFEPNEELTWSQIRLQVNSFLAGLFAGGAFAGATPDQAFFVHCDATTTTQTDIDNGIVNIVVGYAPAKPAEFVILQIEQIAGQTAA